MQIFFYQKNRKNILKRLGDDLVLELECMHEYTSRAQKRKLIYRPLNRHIFKTIIMYEPPISALTYRAIYRMGVSQGAHINDE